MSLSCRDSWNSSRQVTQVTSIIESNIAPKSMLYIFLSPEMSLAAHLSFYTLETELRFYRNFCERLAY